MATKTPRIVGTARAGYIPDGKEIKQGTQEEVERVDHCLVLATYEEVDQLIALDPGEIIGFFITDREPLAINVEPRDRWVLPWLAAWRGEDKFKWAEYPPLPDP